MTDVLQDLPQSTAPAASTRGEMDVSQAKSPGPVSQGHLSADRERCQSLLDTIYHQRASALEGLQRLEQQIEAGALAPNVAENTKLTSLHAKRRTFEQRLEELSNQEEIINRRLEALARAEAQARVDETMGMRHQIHMEGREVAAKLRQALVVVEGLFSEWRDLQARARIAKDVVRSLAPVRMSEVPDFEWATGVEGPFEGAINQVLGELYKAEKELQRRAK